MNKTEWKLNVDRLASTLETRHLNTAELGTLKMLLGIAGEWLVSDRVLARRALSTAAQLVDQALEPERVNQLSAAFAAVKGNGKVRASTPNARLATLNAPGASHAGQGAKITAHRPTSRPDDGGLVRL